MRRGEFERAETDSSRIDRCGAPGLFIGERRCQLRTIAADRRCALHGKRRASSTTVGDEMGPRALLARLRLPLFAPCRLLYGAPPIFRTMWKARVSSRRVSPASRVGTVWQ
ncbi:hypothetical protein MRX96_041573 [Rhipicephalus microplus]